MWLLVRYVRMTFFFFFLMLPEYILRSKGLHFYALRFSIHDSLNIENFDWRRSVLVSPCVYIIEPPHDKTNKMTVRPEKTQISLGKHAILLCPTTRKWRGIMLYPPKFWVSVRLSVRPSVRPSAPTTILVSATPPTVLGQSFWNFTGVLRMVWRYAYCFFYFFITFFPFLT